MDMLDKLDALEILTLIIFLFGIGMFVVMFVLNIRKRIKKLTSSPKMKKKDNKDKIVMDNKTSQTQPWGSDNEDIYGEQGFTTYFPEQPERKE